MKMEVMMMMTITRNMISGCVALTQTAIGSRLESPAQMHNLWDWNNKETTRWGINILMFWWGSWPLNNDRDDNAEDDEDGDDLADAHLVQLEQQGDTQV